MTFAVIASCNRLDGNKSYALYEDVSNHNVFLLKITDVIGIEIH